MLRTSDLQRVGGSLLWLSIALMFLCETVAAGKCEAIDVSGSGNLLSFQANDKVGVISPKQWDLAETLGKRFFSTPYPAGIFETKLLDQWKLIDVGSEGLMHAIVVVNGAGTRGFIFGLTNAFTKRIDKEIVSGRITARHVDSFNEILVSERVNLDSDTQLLEYSLLFLQVATYKFPKAHLVLVANTNDINSIYSARNSLSSISAAQLEILRERLKAPCVSKDSKRKSSVFFTLDAKLDLIEKWRITANGKEIEAVERLSSTSLSETN